MYAVQHHAPSSQAASHVEQDEGSSLQLVVDRLHAQGHHLQCQLQHSGLHTAGMGIRTGGQAGEHLWKDMRPVSVVVHPCLWWVTAAWTAPSTSSAATTIGHQDAPAASPRPAAAVGDA